MVALFFLIMYHNRC